MNRRDLLRMGVGMCGSMLLPFAAGQAPRKRPPNIIFILADDLGVGDLSCYGQKHFQTPHLDAMAEGGIRFTQCYSGAAICEPSRCVLMTGLHTGHATVRSNYIREGARQIRPVLSEKDRTVAHELRDAGYRTGAIGKWHLGTVEGGNGALDFGFDEFHGTVVGSRGGHFPAQRWHNRELRDVERNAGGKRDHFDTDLCADDAVQFIRSHRDKPFLLHVAFSVPHQPLVEVDPKAFAGQWSEDCRRYAGMIVSMDRAVGRILTAVRDAGLDGDTAVFFFSDNGPNSKLATVIEFFGSRGPCRGSKRDLLEGGIRVPAIVRWPGQVPAKEVCDTPWYFTDFLPTAADIAGAPIPAGLDGISMLPTLRTPRQKTEDRFLYWEAYEGGFHQAVRWGRWKAMRQGLGGPIRLHDISNDPAEEHDLAEQKPEVVGRILEYLRTARTDSPYWSPT